MALAARATQTQRPRLLQAVLDAWAQPDVRAKLAFVFPMLVIFPFFPHIPLPRPPRAVLDAWAQPDVRAKLAFVFAMLVIFRFVAHIPIPGVDPERLRQAFEGDTSTR